MLNFLTCDQESFLPARYQNLNPASRFFAYKRQISSGPFYREMVQYVITPWQNRQELLQVRGQLYPQNGDEEQQGRHVSLEIEEKRFAVAKVSVWMQRGNCPHLVESTAILTSAVLNDVPDNSAYCVRAAYAAAFCRFVTGLLDSHQDKRRKLSMYSIAKTIGLPATYVELRHQATHEELPSLSKLRAGTQKALQWIWDYYWAQLTEQKEKPEVDECKILVQRLVAEKNKRTRQILEASLGKWGEARVFETLMELQGTVKDAEALIHIIKLQEKMMSPSSSVVADDEQEPESRGNNLDEVRAELALMERDLTSSDHDEPYPKRRRVEHSRERNSKGWTLWEGPWVPKPIGVV